MTHLLQVTYHPSTKQLDSTHAEMRHLAQEIAQVDGLISKIWTFDKQANLRCGVYLFRERRHAETWRDNVIRARAEEGASDMQTHIFEVLDDFTALTWNTPPAWVR
ncbi:YdhR family protein [Brenneria populi]|uniref:YdhR family protein n=1 Tax=Brenneria populi TaxID=1505588 RepID=A0ABU6JQ68_9GAMM|nr:YdhR family protein [Brenneria populi Li et al. 2015]